MIRVWTLMVAAFLQGSCATDAFKFGSARPSSDQEDAPKWRELDVALPAYPSERDLVEFSAVGRRLHRYFIDGRTLRVDTDGIVRYALVVQAAGGARNVTFEGIRCATREKRIYAHGRADGQWSAARVSRWEPIRLDASNEYQASLYSDYFCPGASPVSSPRVALQAMRARGVIAPGESLR